MPVQRVCQVVCETFCVCLCFGRFTGVARYVVHMLVQITAPVSACFLCLYTYVGVWVRECDQVCSEASFSQAVCKYETLPPPKFNQSVMSLSASRPPIACQPLPHFWFIEKNTSTFFSGICEIFYQTLFPHTSVSIGKRLKHRLNQSLTHRSVLSAGSAALWNGWHPGWVQTPAGRQGTAGMYSEQSQNKQCLKRVLRNLLEHFITQLTIYSSWSYLLGSLFL